MGFKSTAIGKGAIAGQSNKITNATAIGYEALADADFATALGSTAMATGKNSIAIGKAGSAVGLDSIGIGSSAEATGDLTVAIGGQAEASKNYAVALGANSVANEANTVSIGNASLKRRVVNMANGLDDTDGVNVNQLDAGLAQTLKKANNYANGLFSSGGGSGLEALNRRQDSLYERTNAMAAMNLAGAAAAANAGNSNCQDWRRCIGSFSAGIGYMEGEVGGAIMYTRPLSKHGRISFGAGFADNDVGGNIGIGFDY